MSNHSVVAEGETATQVVVDPNQGGRLTSLTVEGRQLLVTEGKEPLAWGCFPMVPFAGRIADGTLTFDHQTHQLPVLADGHAMHGYGYLSEWDVIQAESTDVELAWAFCEPWPWPGLASQRFSLSSNSLTMTMTVTAEQRQPVSFGWHPWFNRDIGSGQRVELGFAPVSMYELGESGIPTGEIIEPSDGPWDNCFTDVEQPIDLRWGDSCLSLASTADYWVVFDEPAHALCVEPQTGFPNDVNMAPHVLDTGQSASAEFTISW